LFIDTNYELENFIEANPNCKTIASVIISGPEVTNLVLFSFFDTIEQLTILQTTSIKNLDFLETVQISKSISLWNIESLESLSKFNNSQPNDFNIINCPKIKTLNLTRPKYEGVTLQSPGLEVITSNHVYISNLNISENVILSTDSQINLNQLWLQNASNYASFESIIADINLDTLANLQITGYDHFSSNGFPDSLVSKNLSIGNIKELDQNGFKNKTAFFKNLSLTSLDNLKNLNAFDDMITEDILIIRDMDSLESLDGIPISEYIEGVFILNNSVLVDISEIEKVDSINRITIEDNNILTECNIDPICALINLPNSTNRTKISGNKESCYDLPNVQKSCQAREQIECRATFLNTTLYDDHKVELSFEFIIPESHEINCLEDHKKITVHLDGFERKEIYNEEIIPNDSEIIKLKMQINNTDLLNENFDCVDIAIQGKCSKENCYFYLCQILNRKDNFKVQEISIYPNPTSQNVTISTDYDFESEILDINGQVIKTIPLKSGSTSIDISELNKGIYLIKNRNHSYEKLYVY
jgi:hypothetical protein